MKRKIKVSVKKYYQIIPLVRLPLVKSNVFTYHSNDRILFGSIVEIKLNNKVVRGVVVNDTFNDTEKTNPKKPQTVVFTKPNFATSPILKIITSAQITLQQLKLAQLISSHYLTPLSITLKFFASRLTKNNNHYYFENLIEQVSKINESKWEREITLTVPQKNAIKKIISQANIKSNNKKTLSKNSQLSFPREITRRVTIFDFGHSTLLFGPPASGKTEVIIEVIRKTLKNKQQSLILIPEIFLSYQEIVRYSSKFIKEKNDEVAILHSKLKPSEITTIWNGVKSGQIKIIISTRMGIFLPFKRLGLIVVDEEQDISHKQWDTPPFYHTRDVTSLMQQSYSTTNFTPEIILVSSTPSLSSYQKLRKNKNWQLVKLPSLEFFNNKKRNKVLPPTIELVDLKKYYKKGQQIFISNELRFALKNTLDRNKIALLLVPRRGKSSTIICQDCREVPTCPDCQVPLVHSENSYRCLHCNFKISNISKCPHCGSFRLSDLGFGTESVKDAIQTTFPSAKIAIADSLTFNKEDTRQKILSDLYNNKLDFLVGTYTITKGLDIKDVEMVAILNADNWPGQTDFRFDENYLSTIFQLAGRVNRPGGSQNGKCLVQTFDPTNRIFTYLRNWDWETFLKYELENRQTLNYPPFKHLLKITYRNYNRETIEKELDKLYKKLEKYLADKTRPAPRSRRRSGGSGIVDEEICQISGLLPPYFGFQERLRGQWHKHLLLKVDNLPITDKKLLKILDLPTGWKIDVDTESVF